MAKTTELIEVELFMRKPLTKDHRGYAFTETALLLRKTRDDMHPVHNCDAVS